MLRVIIVVHQLTDIRVQIADGNLPLAQKMPVQYEKRVKAPHCFTSLAVPKLMKPISLYYDQHAHPSETDKYSKIIFVYGDFFITWLIDVSLRTRNWGKSVSISWC